MLTGKAGIAIAIVILLKMVLLLQKVQLVLLTTLPKLLAGAAEGSKN